MSGGLEVVAAVRAALLAHAPLTALLGGAHVYEELPRGAPACFIEVTEVETRDWSTADKTAHEHFLTLAVRTNSRSRALAQKLSGEIEAALDGAALAVEGHRLVSLRLIFQTVARGINAPAFGARMRLRAATEPL
ncbi:DUF3168 domain-containing protein [Aestuariivirga sp.]|uniref:DUF3168 domain-containing protein n=1 Tax=Aestuariivirga sp. TaxID=2650926 RepID=UPI003784713A